MKYRILANVEWDMECENGLEAIEQAGRIVCQDLGVANVKKFVVLEA